MEIKVIEGIVEIECKLDCWLPDFWEVGLLDNLPVKTRASVLDYMTQLGIMNGVIFERQFDPLIQIAFASDELESENLYVYGYQFIHEGSNYFGHMRGQFLPFSLARKLSEGLAVNMRIPETLCKMDGNDYIETNIPAIINATVTPAQKVYMSEDNEPFECRLASMMFHFRTGGVARSLT